MVFPVVEARATAATTAVDTTSHAITMPSGVRHGELLICLFSCDGTPTLTLQNGWTQLISAANTTVVTGYVLFKFASGTDSLTITTSASEQSSHITMRISNAGVPRAASANGSSTNSNPPNENPGFAEDWLWLATRSGDSTTVATVAPTNFAQLQTQAAAGINGASSNTAERSVNATSQDPGTFTSGNEQWASFTVSIPPARRLRQAVIDNFDDNSINGTLWPTITNSGNVSETSSQLQIVSVLGGAISGISNSTSTTNITGFYWGTQCVNAGNQALASIAVYPTQLVLSAGSDQADMLIASNAVQCWTKVATVDTQRSTTTYATWMQYFAIGITSAGNVEWLIGPDGVNWRAGFVLANPYSGGNTSGYRTILAGTNGVEGSTTTMIFENFSFWYQAPPVNASSWPTKFKASYR